VKLPEKSGARSKNGSNSSRNPDLPRKRNAGNG
jgi:hypothetical protein